MFPTRINLFAALMIAASITIGSGSVRGQFPDETPTAPSALGTMASKLNPANWKMPSFGMPKFSSIMPQTSEQDRIIEKKDGLVSEVSNTAKASWKRTTSALNPMKMLPAANRTPSATQKKPGFFSRLFSPPPPENSSTVTDFLKRDRIGS